MSNFVPLDISDLNNIAAPSLPVSEIEEFRDAAEDILEANGFTLQQASRAAVALQSLLIECAAKLGAEMIRHRLRSLPLNAKNRALERVVLGADQSLEADAAECGTSKQLINYHEKKTVKMLVIPVVS